MKPLEDLIIESDKETFFIPEVKFLIDQGTCSISGESFLEDTFEFYEKLTVWFDGFFALDKESITLDFKLRYFNTSSSRAILDMLRVLKSYHEKGKSITINWHYPEPDDDDLLLEAEDFEDESGLVIHKIPYDLKL